MLSYIFKVRGLSVIVFVNDTQINIEENYTSEVRKKLKDTALTWAGGLISTEGTLSTKN